MSELSIKPELILDVYPTALSKPPARIPGVGVVIIRDGYGNEVAIASALPSGHVTVTTASMPDFKQRLSEFGIESRVEVIRV